MTEEAANTETPETQEGTESVESQSSVSVLETEESTSTEGETPEGTDTKKVSVTEEEPDGDVEQSHEGAPEAYEEFTTPEGVDSLDGEVLTAFGEAAKEANLTQESAQAILDKVTPVLQERAKHKHEAQVQSWANQVASDPEFGGENLDENVRLARSAYRRVASEKLQTFLTETGLDVHPEMLKLFRFIGSKLSEDKVVQPGNAPSESLEGDVFLNPEVAMDRLYGKRKKR